eukprot:gb/GEZN01022954.1/.p1 GENE.gb/GEZN01022954.1/~~gb/GEZN01022954.1/.p1  ORF type:complete len:172 (+),score=0.12 gb/GEZN01022954.1/:79-594(+)
MAFRADAKADMLSVLRGYELQKKSTCSFHGAAAEWPRYIYEIKGHLGDLSIPVTGPEGEPWVTPTAEACLTRNFQELQDDSAGRRPRNNVPSNAQIQAQCTWLRRLCVQYLRPTLKGPAIDIISTLDPSDPYAIWTRLHSEYAPTTQHALIRIKMKLQCTKCPTTTRLGGY